MSNQGTEWVSGYGIAEVMDVTGLNGREASRLALLLANWNMRHQTAYAPLFQRRGGKRFIRSGLLRVDLANPIMAPYRDDILAAIADPTSAREFDVTESFEFDAAGFEAAYSQHIEEREFA